MNKQILTIVMCIAFISLSSALYAGDCLQVNLSTMQSLDNVTWNVVGNSSNMIGLNIELNETNKIANIRPVINYKPDSFTIIFTDSSTNIVEVAVGSSGGSSGGGGGRRTIYETEYVYENITQYIEREEPPKTNEDEIIDSGTCIQKPNNNLIFFIIIIINALLLVGIISTIIIKNKKIDKEFDNKEEPFEKEETQVDNEISEEYY